MLYLNDVEKPIGLSHEWMRDTVSMEKQRLKYTSVALHTYDVVYFFSKSSLLFIIVQSTALYFSSNDIVK